MKFSSCLIAFALLVGCGSETPFQRGAVYKKEGGNSGQEKPLPEKTETPIPIPTSEPTVTPTPSVVLNRSYFNSEILPFLEAKKINGDTKGCSLCHSNPAPTFEEAEKMVVLGHPEESLLFRKATGAAGSGHMAIWTPDSPEALKLIYWINGKYLE